MEYEELQRFVHEVNPATTEQIGEAQQQLGLVFPQDYVDLLRYSNGFIVTHHRKAKLYSSTNVIEGSLEEVRFFSTMELKERNDTYHVQIYLPKFILVGDIDGEKGIFLDLTGKDNKVYLLELGTMILGEAALVAFSLNLWIKDKFNLNENIGTLYPKKVDVYLLRSPIGGKKDLIKIKQSLNILTPISEINKGISQLPFRLLKSVPFGRYALLISQYNITDNCLGLTEVDESIKFIPLPPLG